MDMQQPMNDAERAALNHKFEYERAKKLRAAEAQANGINTPSNLLPGQAQMLNMTPAERGTQIHAEIEAAIELAELRLEVSKLTGVANQLRHENLMLKRQGLLQSFVSVMNQPLVDLKHDIMVQTNSAQNDAPSLHLDWYRTEPMVTMETPAPNSPSILKLALSLTARFLLVLGVAIAVLEVVSK